jgi:NAD(P) transhydrogenase subunit alpha
MKEGATLIAPFYPLHQPIVVRAIAGRKMTSIALDLIPRTTVAQMMDVLSSQATVAGYCAVLMAANTLPRFFPMLMTAAGTIAPARVLILGAGVAGLQAIGTAKRLGAVVEAFDVRKVVKEQVESLGAKFVEVESAEDAQTAGGYAKESSEEYKKKQSEALARHVKTADVVISTALIPGQRAPILVTEDMVKTMKAGSVIVDLAAEQQGNCALTETGKVVEKYGVTIMGLLDLPSRLPLHASQMFSRNVEKLLLHVIKEGAWKLDVKDEIVAGCLVTVSGDVVHPRVKEKIG